MKKLPKKTVSQDKQIVKFEVKAVGEPKPKVRWLKQGEELLPSEEFQIENLEDGTSILIINDVYPDDAGEIKFEAVNSVGVAETVSQFVVEEGNIVPNILISTISFPSSIVIKVFFQQPKKDLQQFTFLNPLLTFHKTLFVYLLLEHLLHHTVNQRYIET